MWFKYKIALFTLIPVLGVFILRFTGWLQPLEWTALDSLFQSRPLEPPDQRILIVSVEEEDIQKLGQWPMSDKVLADLITKLKLQKARVIGLDIYRDLKVEPGHKELINVFKTTPNLIGVEKALTNTFSPNISPSSVLKRLDQVSSNDLIVDGDGVVRRGFLYPDTKPLPSLGLALALDYLEKEGVSPTATNNDFLKLKQSVFTLFKSNHGGYTHADDGGYQVLLNFRGPRESFQKVSLFEILENRVSPDLIRGRIVIIGSQSPSIGDTFYTPYSKSLNTSPIPTYGVEIHANLASQILSSALDNRPLIKVTSEVIEAIIIVLSAGATAILIWKWRHKNNEKNFSVKFLLRMVVAISLPAIILIGGSYLSFQKGLWVPVVAPLLALSGSAIINIPYITIWRINKRLKGKTIENFLLNNQQEEYFNNLEAKVEERTQELNDRNEELEKSLKQIKAEQEETIIQQQLASLSVLALKFTEEIQIPVSYIRVFSESSVNFAAQLQEYIFEDQYLDSQSVKNINNVLGEVAENMVVIRDQGQKIDKATEDITQLISSKEPPKIVDIHNLIENSVASVRESLKIFVYVSFETDQSIEPLETFVTDIERVFFIIFNMTLQTALEKNDLRPEIVIVTKNLCDSIQVFIGCNSQAISQDNLNQIEAFFVMKENLEEKSDLSLYVACNLVKWKLRGKLSVQTEAGKYANFTVVLPKRIA